MFLKSLTINNFRKFGTENNKIEFVDAGSYKVQKEEGKINIAPTTTLIVGKNNSGKTTVTKALDNLINNKKFRANDFNFNYLKQLLANYKNIKDEKDWGKIETPNLYFKLEIGLDDENNDLVTNIAPFMTIGDLTSSELEIYVKYEIQDEEIFKNNLKQLILKNKDTSLEFNKLLDLLDSTLYKINFKNANNENVKFAISDLIELKTIKANNIKKEEPLSDAFNKIIHYRYKSLLSKKDKDELDAELSEINSNLTSNMSSKHTDSINKSLGVIESPERLKVLLSSNLTFHKLMTDLVKYEYVEQNHNIPENQFGLGYTNLMMIIAELIDYMEKYPDQSFNSKVNLISIEEPETFMHPQMQELFIKHINDTVNSLLQSRNKNVNSQLIITTHSSHILNSKIHSGNTFNNINYITTVENFSSAVPLNDEKIKPTSDESENDLKFLKKHIKYKVSELFFSDAIILVEGVTEETLLHYYIENDIKINKYYVSIFNINGAHGLVYHNLIRLLKVPTLVITDLDIKRSDEEKKEFEQISNISESITTNETIKRYNNNSDKIGKIEEFFEEENLRIIFQKKIEGYYATSFEEAFILTNYNNILLNNVLKKLKPNIYKGIVGVDQNKNELKEKSFKLQRKLASSKSDFANELLYNFVTTGDNTQIPSLPDYISNGLNWLKDKLNAGDK